MKRFSLFALFLLPKMAFAQPIPQMDRHVRLQETAMPQPQDFLAAGQSVSDLTSGQIDTGGIINTMIRKGLRGIYMPCGTYKISTKILLASNTSIGGAGACTILSVQAPSDDIISASGTQFDQIHDMTIQADTNRTSGAAIRFRNTFENRIYDVLFTNGTGLHFTNIYLDGANGTHIDRVAGRGGNWDGIILTGSTQRTVDTYINSAGFDGYKNAPLELAWASGVYMSAMDLLGGNVAGVLIDPESPSEVDGVRATAVLADTNLGPGWLFTGDGAVTEFNMTNCWGATNGNNTRISDGVKVFNSNVNGLTIASSEFHANFGAGINIQSGSRIIINGNSVFMNSRGGTADNPGILIGVNPNMLIVTGNQSGAGGEAENGAHLSQQSYAIVSQMPGGHYGSFTGNLATGNQMGNYNIVTGTNVTTSNNVGY